MQRDDEFYEQPNEFIPDRFFEENSVGKKSIYIPFGDGPRNCIGMRMGKMQTKVGLVLMLRKFRYELEDRLKNNKIIFDPQVFLLSPLGGINLHIMNR